MSERRLIDLDEAHQVVAPNGTVYNVKVSNTGEFYTELASSGVGADAVALWKASNYDGTSQFLDDLSGNGHHLRLGSTQPAYITNGVLQLPGVLGNYASTPHKSTYNIAGDRWWVWEGAVGISGTQMLMAQSGVTGTPNGTSFRLYISGSGNGVRLELSDGSALTGTTSSVAPAISKTAPLALGVTWRQSDGRVQFFTAPVGTRSLPGAGGWTQLGTDQTIAIAAVHSASSSPLVEIGARAAGTSAALDGQIYYAAFGSGLDGPAVAEFDPSDQEDFTTSWYSELGEQWTVNSTAGSDSSEPKFLAKESSNYLYLPGVVGNYASVPDANNLDITGDIDIRVKVALDDWTPSTTQQLVAKSTSGQQSFLFDIVADGKLRLEWAPDGSSWTTKLSTIPTGLSDGSTKWVRVLADVDNGASGHDIKFYMSDDGITWSQLGSTVTTAGTTSFFSGTANVEVGTRSGGAIEPAAGKFYRAIIRNVVNDQTVLDIDFSKASPSSNTFTAETGQTVTINRSTSGRKSVVVDRDLFLFGTDDYMEAPDHPDLDFGGSDSFTAAAVFRRFGNSPGHGGIITKSSGSLASGWSLNFSSGSANVRTAISDGSAESSRTAVASTTGDLVVAAILRNTATDSVGIVINTAKTMATDATTGTLANDRRLRIGYFDGVADRADMEFIGAGIWRRALTDEEIALLAGEFGV